MRKCDCEEQSLMRMWEPVTVGAEKAYGMVCTLIAAIRTLLPNLNGPTDSVRKLYCGVWELVVLYATPILSGHETFNEYRRTIRKETHSRCWDCVAEGDDAEHTLLSCPRWINERTLLENYVGEILTINNVIDLVVSSEENWVRFQGICRKIMIARQDQERNMEKRKRR
ncbi:uncharacterized protein LOC126874758 [Bombus huntii]|uniref:uncharacterized protein LOC126874758 n=1 Tax=Bombus huntii TaxID=85661 RepID=UPI0021AA8052|nr:uncharacterized protein LOC126874758 [Bombus huntii]